MVFVAKSDFTYIVPEYMGSISSYTYQLQKVLLLRTLIKYYNFQFRNGYVMYVVKDLITFSITSWYQLYFYKDVDFYATN